MNTEIKQAQTPFSFDGHGVNDADGQRICKVTSCEPYVYDTGLPQRNPEFDTLSNLFAAAPELLKRLQISNDNISLAHSEKQERSECAFDVDTCNCGLALNWRNNRTAIAKAEGKAQ
jgi:hypothetical protein